MCHVGLLLMEYFELIRFGFPELGNPSSRVQKREEGVFKKMKKNKKGCSRRTFSG